MRVIIDRFESAFAIVELEDKSLVNMPIKLIPEGAREGSVLTIEINYTESEERKNRINNLMDDIWA